MTSDEGRRVESHHTVLLYENVRIPNPYKPEITNYKHHLILKLGQINSKLQYQSLKIRSKANCLEF